MKRAVIVHCWGGNPEYCWYPWVKTELKKRGYTVIVPAMPDSDAPDLSKWLPHLQEVIGEPDDELLLIGHSIGTVTIMRYLETLQPGIKVKQVILVAAFTDPIGTPELENFFVKPLDFKAISEKSINGFTLIQSDNDPYVSMDYGRQLKDALRAKLIIKSGAYHMSGGDDDGHECRELPELLAEII